MKKSNNQNGKKAQKFKRILGINVISTPLSNVLADIYRIITYNTKITVKTRKLAIFTLNPELVLMAQTNKVLKKALQGSDLPVADGIGLAQAVKFLEMPTIKSKSLRVLLYTFQGLLVGLYTLIKQKELINSLNIIKGRKLFIEIIALAKKKRWKIFFLGGRKNEAALAALKLKIKKSRIQTTKGPSVGENGIPVTNVDIKSQKDTIDKINEFSPDLLFVAFNNPKQEIWVSKNISKLKISVVMVVGGTFRYISGLSKLPPAWVNSFGFEWAWRLITEPYRIKRIINATIIFPFKVFLYKVNLS